jgi:hypothetical protein
MNLLRNSREAWSTAGPSGSRRTPGQARGGRHRRQRAGHPPGPAGQDLDPFFLHQGARDGPGARPDAADHPRARGEIRCESEWARARGSSCASGGPPRPRRRSQPAT